MDIDGNLLNSFIQSTTNPTDQRKTLEKELQLAVSRHFQSQSPVRYSLQEIRVSPVPHPRGWNAFDVKISVSDNLYTGVRGLPTITLDIAAPEALGEGAIAPLKLDSVSVMAYTLERIAGEKLRAFLSSLPEYRAKLKKPGDAVRVKDIYDIARIYRKRPEIQAQFWKKVGGEFRLACESRLIDCAGIVSFEQDLETTESAFKADPTIPKDIKFDEAWNSLRQIVEFLQRHGFIPFKFPID